MYQPRRSQQKTQTKTRRGNSAKRRGVTRKLAAATALPQPFEALEPRVLFSTYVVNSTADSGIGSLRQAIVNANANPGADTITFNLAGSGVHSLTLATSLPTITDTVNIDGTSQSGYAGVPLISLDGAHGLSDGLVVAAANSRIVGLAIGGFTNSGITISAGGAGSSVVGNYVGTLNGTTGDWNDNGVVVLANNVTVGGLSAGAGNVISGNQRDGVVFNGATGGSALGNMIGLSADGAHVLGNARNGVNLQGSANVAITGNVISANFANGVNVVSSSGVTITGNCVGTDATGTLSVDGFNTFGNSGNGVAFGVDAFGNTVGGPNTADRNVISNNSGDGVRFETSGGVATPATNLVQGNFIGVDASGAMALPNSNGVTVVSGSVAVVLDGNVISGNWGSGVWLEDAAVVQGNLIGVAADGASPMGNMSDGVSVFASDASGAGSTIQSNTIAFNLGNGVGVYDGANNAIRSNRIYSNSMLGIDLAGDGVTANDSAGHVGPNNYANFPVINSVDNAAGTLTLIGALDSTPSTSFTLDFFSASAADPTGYGQGEIFLGSAVVTTDASGHATFTVQFTNVAAGQNFVTATATDFAGNTSEFGFSQAIPASRVLAGSLTSLSSSGPSILNQQVTLTATVSALSGTDTPTGSVTFKDGNTVLAVVSLVNGVATLNTSTLGVGTHTLTAVYDGDAEFAGSASGALSQVVNKIPTTTNVVSSSPLSTIGAAVSFTATVTGAGGTPTGLVGFFDGNNVIGSATLVNGVATFTTSLLTTGSHTITAFYLDDASYAPSDSSSITQTIGMASTTTTLQSSVNPALVGATIVLTAHVTSLSGMPDGTVTFMDGNSVLGTAAVLNGFAVLSVSTLGVGAHNLTASYGGAADFSASASTTLVESVGKSATSLNLGSTSNPSTYGGQITFSVSVLTAFGHPTGTVTFSDGNTALATVTVVNDVATLQLSTLGVGSHTINAVYSGDANFAASNATPLVQVVGRAATVTGMNASASTLAYGQALTLTANVSANVGGMTGLVTFFDGATAIGSATVVNGVATLTTAALNSGSHSITAAYGGDANFGISSSIATAVVVNPASTSTGLGASANPVAVAQSMTLTASISTTAGAVGGLVTFFDGSQVLGTAAVSGGVATLNVTLMAAGHHSLTASYGGDSNHLASGSAAMDLVVNPAVSSTTLGSSSATSVVGQSVTFTASVSSVVAGLGTPSGVISFFDGATPLGTATLVNGVATFTTSSLATGSHSITAQYGSDATFAGSASAAMSQTVSLSSTTTTLSPSANSITFGQSLTLTANVATGFGSATGSVVFRDGATVLGSVNLVNGVATWTVSAAAAGTHSFTASYGGDAAHASSASAAQSVTVNRAGTSTSLTSSANPATVTQTVTFTATITSAAGVPSGTITFSDGSTVLGTVTLANGVAKLATSGLAAGSHSIVATYNGDANFNTSGSAALSQTVNKLATTTTLAASPNPCVAGQAVTLTATVSSSGTIGGTMSFFDGSTLLGTATVVNGVATLSTSSLGAGTHNLSASYGGDASHNGSASAVLAMVVNAATTSTISGHVYNDLTGNGLTADDTALAGVTVELYLDRNGNGKVDGKDGAAVASVVTGPDGRFTFANLPAGHYLVQQVVPNGFNETSPNNGVYAVNATAGSTTVNQDFADTLNSKGNGKKSITLAQAIAALTNLLDQLLALFGL